MAKGMASNVQNVNIEFSYSNFFHYYNFLHQLSCSLCNVKLKKNTRSYYVLTEL